jgi:hypothetical protein
VATLDERVAALESELRAMREEWVVVQQAPLLNARMLSALRETQVEHGRTLAEHGRTLAEHGRTLAEHTAALGEIRHSLGTVVGMLQTLIDREPTES